MAKSPIKEMHIYLSQSNKPKTKLIEIIIHCFKEKFVFDIGVFDLVEVIEVCCIRQSQIQYITVVSKTNVNLDIINTS